MIVAGRGDDRINGRGGDDLICGRSGDDRIRGGGGDDKVRGWRGEDSVKGGPGDDRLLGGLHDDTLRGNSGDDLLDGGAAQDDCDGGSGANTLVHCEATPNEAPTDLTLAPTAVAENQPAGALVGSLGAVDPDPGDTHAFTLVTGTGGSDNSSFSISGSSLRTAAVLDHEATPTRSIRVRATDSGGQFVEKQLTITVTDVDDPPVALDDTKTVTEDAPATAIDVLANDADVDGGPISIASVTQPAHGNVVITGGGTGLTYAPAANYCNTPTPPFDTFAYTLAPGTSTATVSVTVTCVDDAPVAVDDAKTLAEDDPATPIAVLANDTDVDAGPKSIQSVTQPLHGTVAHHGRWQRADVHAEHQLLQRRHAHRRLHLHPDTGRRRGDRRRHRDLLRRPAGGSQRQRDRRRGRRGHGDRRARERHRWWRRRPEDGPVGDPARQRRGRHHRGRQRPDLRAEHQLLQQPPGTSPDTFTYTLNGGNTATVSITVTCSDDAPVAVNDAATVAEDSGPSPIDVLTNDTDVDGGPKSVQSITQPANGSAAITGGGTGVSYTPNANYCNQPPGTSPDTFTYTLNGGSTATVSVTVTCAADAPVLNTAAGTT